MRTAFAVLLALSTPVAAQQQQPPDEAAKRAALMRGYQLNDNLVMRPFYMGSIDVTPEAEAERELAKVMPRPPKKDPHGQ
jgi:hypothetical protein